MLPKTRQRNIVRMRRNNPCATLQEVGDRFGVTRERARQILEQAGEPTVAYQQTYLCLQCDKDIGRKPRLFCSPECRHNYQHIKIACTYCGQLGEYLISHLMWHIAHGSHGTDLFFCSHICQGRWLGENYGFVVTGNRGNREKWGKQRRKWDRSKVYELKDETGWGAARISRALGIPESTISWILAKRN